MSGTAQQPDTHVHVYTENPAEHFEKQFPGSVPRLNGRRYTFGRDIPKTADALIVFNRTHVTMGTTLPKNRRAIIAAEPKVIFGYKRKYLEQFGHVVTTLPTELDVETWRTATCWYWYAGINFDTPPGGAPPRGYDFFDALQPPEKTDKISIVTSDKTITEYQRRRLTFVEEIAARIPDRLEIFGRGIRDVPDKMDALLPYKYHIALENCAGQDTWTEKFADPVLCWAYPFYAGCDNLHDYFPSGSYCQIDLDAPDKAVDTMLDYLNHNRWEDAQKDLADARQTILKRYNLAFLLDRLSAALFEAEETPDEPAQRYIWSERTFYPEEGTRGSVPEWIVRNTLLFFNKQAEARIKDALSRRRAKRDR